jgi:hypothetical protein
LYVSDDLANRRRDRERIAELEALLEKQTFIVEKQKLIIQGQRKEIEAHSPASSLRLAIRAAAVAVARAIVKPGAK